MNDPLTLVITDTPGDIYASLMSVRQESYFPSAYDERYWGGGIHKLLSAEEIRRMHAEDAGSMFALAFTPDNQLQAYSRFTVGTKLEEVAPRHVACEQEGEVTFIHIIAARSQIRGQALTWQVNGQARQGKVGRVLYDEICNFSIERGMKMAVAEVCVYPVPNIPSLLLHRNAGFVALGKGEDVQIRASRHDSGETIAFSRFAKPLFDPCEL